MTHPEQPDRAVGLVSRSLDLVLGAWHEYLHRDRLMWPSIKFETDQLASVYMTAAQPAAISGWGG